MSQSLAFKERPSLGHGFILFIYYLFIYLLFIETDYNTSLSRVQSLSEAIINGYGTQEDDTFGNRLTFWQALEQEIVAAKNDNCMILIQMDANAKIGKDRIPDDPNEESKNGRIMMEMVERQELAITNTF